MSLTRRGLVAAAALAALPVRAVADAYPKEAISPDGKLRAYVTWETPKTEGEPGPATLWLEERESGHKRVLLASTPGDTPQTDLTYFDQPNFSLNGGFIYIMAAAWVTSGAIHQVKVADGSHRFVIDGNSLEVIRKGKWAGWLIVERHMYRGEEGAYDPFYVVRPDGKETFLVPGTDGDDPLGALERWVVKNA